ncbi:phosphatidylglycerophosphatase A [Photobacterium damselae]|uniref:Phosphatidylglycerophosphatase A n=2 Tax=Photobacterium damselae TaxID=38293 RepID=A0A1V1V9C2_PHODP|nr:phosphatidylglycerophosphatase A [Photobacterium damselae]EHA1081112.1 phosphatidylglycerophosphatase A [Photobacterium damselae]ELV7515096.1 phosphatidylglycerophosphatase A [Photobacterium damselae]MBA5683347.1 phosphatidylglycerophosphatase A [Photobacterium damselae subsp. damselae]MBE8129891.1 phosphatidylglycerophosphatase A [Photobacterium damselae subsp. piscicida]MCG3811700.1 phosphatidylglycerophosphatase A [Photobacterium damselae]
MSNPKDLIKLSNPWHLLATGFGSGLAPIVPGTVGTLAAIPLYWVLAQLPFLLYLLAIVIAAIIGVTICQKTSDDMKVHDHGSIVWDEFVGFWITMAIAPTISWQWILAGFILFRFFDMLKPWPISWLDKHVSGGFGIMIDDIVAGFMAMISLWFVGYWLGL